MTKQTILTVGNSKGGVGKSTIAVNLAVEAVTNGKKVLLIDADIQGSAMAFRGLREASDIKATALTGAKIHEDIEAFSNFDWIIIDAGGRDSKPFRSAVWASDFLLLPVLPSQFDIYATSDTVEMFRELRPLKKITGRFVLNQVQENTKIAKAAYEALQEFNDIPLLSTVLHGRVAFKNSISEGLGVTEYEPSGKAAQEIRSLYKEIAEMGEAI